MPLPHDFTWEDLDYWRSKEWGIVTTRLNEMDAAVQLYCPRRELMFAALDATPFDRCKVALVFQDPYPDRECASGLAVSVPNGTIPTGYKLPPTLDNIFKEYVRDLHYPYPNKTDLLPWANRGVLLWNAIPTCAWRQSLSHDWYEYVPLTTEIIRRLSDRKKTVFVLMGNVARRYRHVVDTTENTVIETSHPSPRGSANSRTPFVGSRVFSRCNSGLAYYGVDPIDWKL